MNVHFFADGEKYDYEQRGGGVPIIFSYDDSAHGRADLASAFRLCSVPKDYAAGADVAYWASNGLGNMTMGSYLKLLVRLSTAPPHRQAARQQAADGPGGRRQRVQRRAALQAALVRGDQKHVGRHPDGHRRRGPTTTLSVT